MAYDRRPSNGEPRKEFDDTNRGALWKNKKKARDEDADYTGNQNIDGREHYLNAWRVKSENPNAPVLRLSIKPKGAEPARRQASARTDYHASARAAPDPLDDDPLF